MFCFFNKLYILIKKPIIKGGTIFEVIKYLSNNIFYINYIVCTITDPVINIYWGIIQRCINGVYFCIFRYRNSVNRFH